MIHAYRERAGEQARTIGQVPLSYDAADGKAREHVRRFAFGVHGWKVMAIGADPGAHFRFWTDEFAPRLEKAAG